MKFMKKLFLFLSLFESLGIFAQKTIEPDTVIVRSKVCEIGYGSWKSTNKENGSISDKTISFYANAGDSISFNWKVSSEENGDKLVIGLDGIYLLTKSGDKNGTEKWGIETSGEHTVQFVYAKDFFSYAGSDEAQIDDICVSVYRDSLFVRDFECNAFVGINYYGSYGGIANRKYDSPSFFVEKGDSLSLIFSSIDFSIQGSCRSTHYSYRIGNGNSNLFASCDDYGHPGKISNITFGKYYIPVGSQTIHVECSSFDYPRSNLSKFSLTRGLPQLSYPLYNLVDGEYSSWRILEDFSASKFNYSRTFSNTNWQSFYVPFSMSYDDWKEDFEVAKINNVNMYDTDDDGEADVTELEIIKVKKGALKPNHPYMIKAKKTGDKVIKLADATLYATEENPLDVSSAEMKFTFTGTYSGVSGQEMMDGHYYAMAGGELCYTDNNQASLKPYRWYMKVESRDPQVILPSKMANVRVRVVGEDVEATEIAEVETETESAAAPIYALDGRVVSKDGSKEGLGAGIYIKNGKKFIVK